MAERMTKIEQGARAAGFALVRAHDAGLGRDADGDCMRAGVHVAVDQRRAVRFAPRKKVGIVDQAVFDHFGIACAQLADRQSIECRRVDQDERGLIKGTDEVLARAGVDRRLAADRRIDLREQGRRDLNDRAAALDDGSRKAGDVADDAAAKRDDHFAAFDFESQKLVTQAFELRPVLGALTGRQDDRVNLQAGGGGRFGQRGEMKWRNIGVGNNNDPACFGQRLQVRPCMPQRTGFDDNVVAAVAQPHGNPVHPTSFPTMASTVDSCGCAWLRIWIGASA